MGTLQFDDNFLWWLGSFYGAWASIELMTCYAVGKLLRLTHEEAHILTAGMEFGRKIAVLRNLVYRSDLANKPVIMTNLNIMMDTKRNVFAHGFIISNEKYVTFIDRSRGGDYTATLHQFTLEEFAAHVERVIGAAAALETALEVTSEEIEKFGRAALSTVSKSNKSPDPASSKA